MKTGILLRWIGGAGGDTLCHLLSSQNDVYMNATFYGITEDGQTSAWSKLDNEFPSFYKFSKHTNKNEDIDSFKHDIIKLSEKKIPFIIKHHLFDKDFDRELQEYAHIVDIGINLDVLPFVVKSNLEKTSTMELTYLDDNLKKIISKLDDKQKQKIVIWNVVQNDIRLMKNFDLVNSPLQLGDFFHKTENVGNFFKTKGLKLDLKSKYFIDWLEKNKKFQPNKKYQEYINNKNYQFDDDSLDMVERYVLLALSNGKFRFLE